MTFILGYVTEVYVTSVPGVKIFEGKFIWRADIWAHNNEYNKRNHTF